MRIGAVASEWSRNGLGRLERGVGGWEGTCGLVGELAGEGGEGGGRRKRRRERGRGRMGKIGNIPRLIVNFEKMKTGKGKIHFLFVFFFVFFSEFTPFYQSSILTPIYSVAS